MHTSSTLRFLALCSVLVLAACSKPASDSAADAGTETDDGEMMTMSMKDLVKLGKNYTCTFQDTEDDVSTEGTVYVEGEKNFRGDFSMRMKNGMEQKSNMIVTNRTAYLWVSDQPQGMMMKLAEDEETFWDSDANEKNDAGPDEDEEMQMNCKKWSPKASMFTPPSDREFVDFQAQMDAMMGGNACAACDQAPDAASKEQCRKAMGC